MLSYLHTILLIVLQGRRVLGKKQYMTTGELSVTTSQSTDLIANLRTHICSDFISQTFITVFLIICLLSHKYLFWKVGLPNNSLSDSANFTPDEVDVTVRMFISVQLRSSALSFCGRNIDPDKLQFFCRPSNTTNNLHFHWSKWYTAPMGAF